MENCIFCKIRDKEIATSFVYTDETIMVFNDQHPQKPIHVLIVPKKHVKEFLAVEDVVLFEKLGIVIQRMIRELGLSEKGYKISINGGGSQDVDHLHIHLMGPMAPGQKDA